MAKIDIQEVAEDDSINIVEELDEDTLKTLGHELVTGFHNDEQSRTDWIKSTQEWVKLAMQVVEKKSFPWAGAANMKYPLLATAALQFQARAYPALVPGPELVSAYVTGKDPQGLSFDRAGRISKHMSYQIMYEMEGWEEEMDKLCLMLPIVGTVFKKTFYSPLKGYNCSHLVKAEDLVLNYWAKSLKESARISHLMQFNRNQIEEKFRSRLWKKIDLGEPVPYTPEHTKREEVTKMTEPQLDYTTPHSFIEVHTWWDLDDDGYREPWIITIHLESEQIVRIVPRFDAKGVHVDEEGEIVKIDPIEYFTKYGFIPNPDGSAIYDVGFGLLLGNINHSIDTLVNQLIDSGTLNNLQAGFIGRGIRIKGGGLRFTPGEWKQADFTGDDIKKNIFPLPTKEPSDVLFKLLELLLNSGKELASIAEIMVGKLPGQNTPATTTQMSVDQSLKIFTAIYKRMYRSLTEEYMKLFRLNGKFMPDTEVYIKLNFPDAGQQPAPMMNQEQGPEAQMQQPQQPNVIEIARSDYEDNILVKPNADPNIVSEAQKLARAQGLIQLLELGTVNIQEATRQILEAGKFERIAALLQPNPQQPDPKQIELQMKMQIEQQKAQLDQQKAAMDLQLELKKGEMDVAMKQMELEFKQREMDLKAQEAQMKAQITAQTATMDMQMNQQQHQQDMVLSREQHQNDMVMSREKMDFQREQMNARTQTGGKSGGMGGMAKQSGNSGGKGGAKPSQGSNKGANRKR